MISLGSLSALGRSQPIWAKLDSRKKKGLARHAPKGRAALEVLAAGNPVETWWEQNY